MDLPVGWGYLAVESDAIGAIKVYGTLIKILYERYKDDDDWEDKLRAVTDRKYLERISVEAKRLEGRARDENPLRNKPDGAAMKRFFPNLYGERIWDGSKWRKLIASEESRW